MSEKFVSCNAVSPGKSFLHLFLAKNNVLRAEQSLGLYVAPQYVNSIGTYEKDYPKYGTKVLFFNFCRDTGTLPSNTGHFLQIRDNPVKYGTKYFITHCLYSKNSRKKQIVEPVLFSTTEYRLNNWLIENKLFSNIQQITINNEIYPVNHADQICYNEKVTKGTLLSLKIQFKQYFENGKNFQILFRENYGRKKYLIFPYFIYIDNFEINNPLWSHSTYQSISAIYYSFPLIENNFKLSNILSTLYKNYKFAYILLQPCNQELILKEKYIVHSLHLDKICDTFSLASVNFVYYNQIEYMGSIYKKGYYLTNFVEEMNLLEILEIIVFNNSLIKIHIVYYIIKLENFHSHFEAFEVNNERIVMKDIEIYRIDKFSGLTPSTRKLMIRLKEFFSTLCLLYNVIFNLNLESSTLQMPLLQSYEYPIDDLQPLHDLLK
ncbi:C2H2-type domain-containing protein, partial [Aphis craccivora]